MSEEFIREVDEDLRHQHLTALWKKYGTYVIGTAVGVILFVAIFQGYGKYQESRFAEESRDYAQVLKALEEGKTDQALAELTVLSKSGMEGYQVMAAFKKADLLLDRGDRAAAVAALDEVAGNGDIGKVYRDLAAFQAATMLIDEAAFDEIKSRLDPLTAEGNAWQFLALEMLSMAALKHDNAEQARAILTRLVENLETPPNVKMRAEQLINIIE